MDYWTKDDPELMSIENFVEHLIEEGLDTFTGEELQILSYNTRTVHRKVRADLEGYGLKLAERAKERRVRGFTTSSNDRWYGPGSSPTHGGSGWEQIAGFAGREG